MKFVKNDFIKSVSVLITGTFLAQLISILASPIISRIYGPEENAYLGLFLKITTLIATISTARLELVIPIEKNKHYAFGIYQFSVYLSLLIAVICFVLITVFSIISSQKFDDLLFLITIPIGILMVAFFNLGNSWELRHENYRSISVASIILSLVSNGIKIGGGLLFGHFLILIGATIIGYFSASFSFLKSFVVEKKSKLLTYKSKRTKTLLKQNQDFYTYNLFHVLLDLSRDMLIVSFIWTQFGKADFGSYEFSFRMMKLPIVFIGAALSQVFFRKAKDLVNSPIELKRMMLKTVFYTFILGIIPFTLLYFFGEEIFTFIFGKDWKVAGEIAEIISIWLFMNFIFTPISFVPILLNKQKIYFWINFIFLFLILFLGFYFFIGNINFENCILSFSMLNIIYFIVLLVWFYKLLVNKLKLEN